MRAQQSNAIFRHRQIDEGPQRSPSAVWMVLVALALSIGGQAAHSQDLFSQTSIVDELGPCAGDSGINNQAVVSTCDGGLATAVATSSYGHLGGFTFSNLTASGFQKIEVINSMTSSRFRDQITISSGDLTGSGLLTFSIYLDLLRSYGTSTVPPLRVTWGSSASSSADVSPRL